jgi:hypothetical protein
MPALFGQPAQLRTRILRPHRNRFPHGKRSSAVCHGESQFS